VPDPLLHDGSNRVDAYRLGGDGSLSPLRIG
jgi:hypothetical protein